MCCEDKGVKNHIVALKWFIILAESIEDEELEMKNIISAVRLIVIGMEIFISEGITGSEIGDKSIQLRAEPLVIAPNERATIGVLRFVFLSW